MPRAITQPATIPTPNAGQVTDGGSAWRSKRPTDAGASRRRKLKELGVRLGQSLQLVTVAEGVEDHAQFLALRRMGCDIGQGFYFGRPMEPEQLERLLADDPTPARTPASRPRCARGWTRPALGATGSPGSSRRSVLEHVRRVVPWLPAGDLEAAPDLGVAVDADDLLAGGAPPSLEPVGRTL
jgi:EAL domain